MDKFGVKAVVRLTGLNENTLRAWERRYNVVQPERDEAGHRLYSTKDLERLQLLTALVKEGHAIGRISEFQNPVLKKMLKTSLSPQATEIVASEGKTQAYLREIIQALQKFELQRLNQTLQRARFEMGQKEIIMNLVRPLLGEVGMMVNSNQMTISQEHLLSSMLRDFLGNMHQSLSPYDFSSRDAAKRVMLTTREGDLHEFSILMSAILSNLYHCKTYYLGPSMPVTDLADSVTQLRIDTLILGAMPLPPDKEVISLVDYLKVLDRSVPRSVTFCIGGARDMNTSFLRQDRHVILVGSLAEMDQYLSRWV